MCALTAESLEISPSDVIVASTGVIGQPLSIEPIKNSMKRLADALSADGSVSAAEAIITTDLALKEVAVSFTLNGLMCKIGGIAKGSGMIHPNMATMLAFITTDVAITPLMLQKALSADVQDSFNMISVDGDTSTNDMVSILANGEAGNPVINSEGEAYDIFCKAPSMVTRFLCRAIAKDGEGATKLIECSVTGAKDKNTARIAAKSVVCSSLVKAAMFGADANWGRILCALGYSGAELDVTKIAVAFSSTRPVDVAKTAPAYPFEENAKRVSATR